MCHANSPAEVRQAGLQYIAAVSSQSGHVCDALTDHTRNSTLVKLLALTSSNDTLVCALLNFVSLALSVVLLETFFRAVQMIVY